MKKLLSLVLCFLLLFSLSSVAFAEEEKTSYYWFEALPRTLELFPDHNMVWKIEEVDALMWLPDAFLPIPLTDEDTANGCIGMYLMEDSDAFVLLSYSDLSGMTLDSLFSYYSQNGYDARMITVNEIPAILVRDTEANTLTLTYQTRDNMFFQVIFSPVSDPNYTMIFDMVICSIQPDIQDEPDAEPVVPTNPVSSLISK